jgi:hypothetical protein
LETEVEEEKEQVEEDEGKEKEDDYSSCSEDTKMLRKIYK